MTSPDLYQPGQPGRLEDMKPTIGGLASVMLSNVGTIAQNIFRGIADALGGLFGGQEGALGEISDGQEELRDRTDLFGKLLDQGACYMPAGQGFSGVGRLPFNTQRGPSKGVTFENNGIRLGGQGAWQVMVEVKPDFVAITNSNIVYRINCYRPDGGLFTHQEYTTNDASAHTESFGADFVVNGPDYFVAVHVYRIGTGWRGHLGGWAITRFVVKRISADYENQVTGGSSDNESEPPPAEPEPAPNRSERQAESQADAIEADWPDDVTDPWLTEEFDNEEEGE